MDFENQSIFRDRIDAGKQLSELLVGFKNKDTVVYALPRGGVLVGAEVAKFIHAPLDLIITRKIGHPFQPEYAIGAVAENGHSILNKASLFSGENKEEVLEIDENYLTAEAEKQKEEAKRRHKLYLGNKKPIPCKGKVAILVDDGIATGLTIKTAINELKSHYHPEQIIVAVPVAPSETAGDLEKEGIKLIAVKIEKEFLGAIGAYYQSFPPVEDNQVIETLEIISRKAGLW